MSSCGCFYSHLQQLKLEPSCDANADEPLPVVTGTIESHIPGSKAFVCIWGPFCILDDSLSKPFSDQSIGEFTVAKKAGRTNTSSRRATVDCRALAVCVPVPLHIGVEADFSRPTVTAAPRGPSGVLVLFLLDKSDRAGKSRTEVHRESRPQTGSPHCMPPSFFLSR